MATSYGVDLLDDLDDLDEEPRAKWPLIVGVIALLAMLTPPALFVVMMMMFVPQLQHTATAGSDLLCMTGAAAGLNLDAEQQANAATIVATGHDMNMPAFGIQIALATALQESSLKVLDHGDVAGPDSRGLFQQRDSWGPLEVRMDPAGSARLFYTALTHVAGWQQLALTDAAAAVQRPAQNLRGAYAKWGPAAGDIIAAAAGTDCAAGIPVVSVGPGGWSLPVASYVLTARFGQCSSMWQSCHTGLDFAAPTGTPIMAAAPGVVVAAGFGVHGGSYGNLTEIDNGAGVHTWYAHQSAIQVTVGQQVQAGQVIGLVGATGNVTGPHLHLEVRVNGTAIDPFTFLTKQGLRP